MAIEDWMNPKVEPQRKPLVIEDYPGYTNSILECLACEVWFEALYSIPLERTVCPKCLNRGVTEVRRIRKIYLQ
jgi:hypothetical protein